MYALEEAASRLAHIPEVTLREAAPLSGYTRFGIGGPAAVYAEAAEEPAFIEALRIARDISTPYVVIGGGTNLIVSDAGFPGIVLRFTAKNIVRHGACVHADAGADLQSVVDYTANLGLKGVETMTGIPGSIGAAVYGNAGAYGHSLMERVQSVRFFDGEAVRALENAECEFAYRESVFKRRKDWIIFSVKLRMDAAPASDLQRIAADILKIRNEKYPPTMKCAGSIFKNLLLAQLPTAVRDALPGKVVREGKVPSAYFLEQVGAKGMRLGDIQVATYHANLIYNDGQGTAHDLCRIIAELKRRVHEHFGFELQEEVQYVGFTSAQHGSAAM